MTRLLPAALLALLAVGCARWDRPDPAPGQTPGEPPRAPPPAPFRFLEAPANGERAVARRPRLAWSETQLARALGRPAEQVRIEVTDARGRVVWRMDDEALPGSPRQTDGRRGIALFDRPRGLRVTADPAWERESELEAGATYRVALRAGAGYGAASVEATEEGMFQTAPGPLR